MELLDFMTKGGHKVPPSGPLRVKVLIQNKLKNAAHTYLLEKKEKLSIILHKTKASTGML